MTAMTKLHARATYTKLRLFYLQTMCLLVDYSAPILITLTELAMEE